MHDQEVIAADEFKKLKPVLMQKLLGCNGLRSIALQDNAAAIKEHLGYDSFQAVSRF